MKRNVARFIARFIFPRERKERFLAKHLEPKRGKASGDLLSNEINYVPYGFSVSVYGKGNRVHFGNLHRFDGMLMIGDPDNPVSNCEIFIEDGATSNGCLIYVFENDCRVRIGRDSMISSGVTIFASDTHAILSPDGTLLNRGRFVEIGEHCWLGMNASILKNVSLPKGSIVGAYAVVTHTESVEGGVYAGNPARLVKSGVRWTRNRPNDYVA